MRVDARTIRMGAAVGLEPYLLMAQFLDAGDDDVDDFYEFEDEEGDDGTLDRAAVDALRRGTSGLPDVEAAERLVDQVAALMVSVSTGGPDIKSVDGDYKREYRALSAVLKRLGIKHPNKFPDLWRWYGKWSDGSLPSYASRRVFISELYAPAREALEAKADASREVATGADDGPTGWPDVDARMGALRRRLRDAEETDDFKPVGLQAVSVLEALGRAAFDESRHLPAGKDVPHANDAKTRLGHFLTAVAGEGVKKGERFEHVRTLVRATWRQAQAVKHRDDPNRTDAGIAADSVALLVAIVRRLADQDGPPAAATKDDDIPF
jgi:hypothetical protein